jgi:hypothetical protein
MIYKVLPRIIQIEIKSESGSFAKSFVQDANFREGWSSRVAIDEPARGRYDFCNWREKNLVSDECLYPSWFSVLGPGGGSTVFLAGPKSVSIAFVNFGGSLSHSAYPGRRVGERL